MRKILMIEDEEDLVGFFRQTFVGFPNVEFFSALRAREGVEIALREHPHVLILDLRMPGMSGEEALRQIRRALPLTKVVVVTAWEEEGTQEHIEQEFKVDGYFEKPMELERIVNRVMELLPPE